MKKYKIKVSELLQTNIIVTADSKEAALDEVHSKYHNEEIVLYPCDFISNDFKVVK